MRFPEASRHGDDAHTDAVRRHGEARDQQRRLGKAADAALGTPHESRAAADLYDAKDRFAAREAWMLWIERGV